MSLCIMIRAENDCIESERLRKWLDWMSGSNVMNNLNLNEKILLNIYESLQATSIY